MSTVSAVILQIRLTLCHRCLFWKRSPAERSFCQWQCWRDNQWSYRRSAVFGTRSCRSPERNPSPAGEEVVNIKGDKLSQDELVPHLLPVRSHLGQVEGLAQIHQIKHVFLETAPAKTCMNESRIRFYVQRQHISLQSLRSEFVLKMSYHSMLVQ